MVATAPQILKTDPGSDWLIGGGRMGAEIRLMDWAASPLGPLATWPPSLRTTVNLVLASNFPISVTWGPEHTQIYNDGYWPICGHKHPHSMGQDFSECWASAWPAIGEAFEGALLGKTSFLENQRVFLDRNGYLEEAFFTFSFSPIRDESGQVAGLFHPVTETTATMLSERRTRILQSLMGYAASAASGDEALRAIAAGLREYEEDLPFLLLYVFDPDYRRGVLIACAGLAVGAAAAPQVCMLDASELPWPLAELIATGQVQRVDGLAERFGEFPSGPYPEAPKVALVLPIALTGGDRPVGALVAGVSARLPLNDAYRAFLELLATGIASSFAQARAYEQERQRAEALAELDRSKTSFFSNVSHELRTPLTLMLGPIEEELRERDEPLPPARLERLQIAQRNTLRLLKLVNALLDFSRVEAGRIQSWFQPTDLAALTAELASNFRSATEQAGLALVVDCPPLPEPVFVDRDMWEKIVLNLMSNAFKHTFEGRIGVALRARDGFVELSVSDTGVGIPDSEQPRLFERFHRVKGARSRTHEGTGIGLALVDELVAAHGGEVQVRSQLGEGSVFTVVLRFGRGHLDASRVAAAATPLAATDQMHAFVQEALHWLPVKPGESVKPVASANDNAAVTASLAPAGALGTRRPYRVLWVDDNADMRDYVSRMLAQHYELHVFSDGLAARDAALSVVPDLVLSDIMMPGLDGFGLLRALREDPRTRTVPVILLSARAGEESAVEGLAAGADDYLVKPFAARELLARVRTHLELAALRREWARELEQANQELEAFSYSVSHDLRAPLRAIDGFSKALLDQQGERLDAQGKTHLERVRAAAARMSARIDDLLALARVSRGPLLRNVVSISALAESIADDLRRQAPERAVNFEIEPGLSARADPGLARAMLENLLANAWKFTGQRIPAQIRVGARATPRGEAFYVADNGAGFDMAYANMLFQPFSRLHKPSEFEGTGVGLATVQRIVARHGGMVWAEATPDVGATFYFTLVSDR
ncbi:MAG: ATP-binding protein [Polyangiales bacterium]